MPGPDENEGKQIDKLTKDVDCLKSLGVDAIFGLGSDTKAIAKTISAAVRKKKGRDG
jgi:hypothetical protein